VLTSALVAMVVLSLGFSALSLYFATRAGSLHELHMQVSSLRNEVSLLDDNIHAKEQRERVRRLRAGKQEEAPQVPQRGTPEYKAWLRSRVARGGVNGS